MNDSRLLASDRLRSLVERIERLNEEKDSLAADIREVFSEAKTMGFDVKAIRTVIRLRKMGRTERAEEAAITDLYRRSLDLD